MAQSELYESVAASGKEYFPPIFEADCMFTHTTDVPERLITTANHLYKWHQMGLYMPTANPLYTS